MYIYSFKDVCPFHTKFSLYWERTALERVVQRNCSEIDPNLGGKKVIIECYYKL